MTFSIVTDHDVIEQLENLMDAMRARDLSTASMQRFFDVGEWLLCFEGAWVLAKDDSKHSLRQLPSYQALQAYFADDLD